MEATVEQITAAITALNDKYWYVVMALLFVAGVWFTIRTVGVQVRMLPEMLRSVTAKSQTGFENDGVSPFRAFTISAASRVGTGNVAGVAIAIVIGGPGAVFWMWLLAIIGGATAFVESTLAQLYKQKGSDGYFGGPAYYIRDGLGAKWLAAVFAVAITVTYGFVFNAVQSNSISESVQANWGASSTTAWIVGLGLAALTRHAVVAGLLFVLLWEGLLGGLLNGIRWLAIGAWGRQVAAAVSDQVAAPGTGLTYAVVAAAVVSLGSVWFAGDRLRSFSLRGDE